MHTAQDQFVAHVFHCEPSAGALCKTIEAACKVSTGRQGGGVRAVLCVNYRGGKVSTGCQGGALCKTIDAR